ncbi:MAG: DPP IV N-terminal domain-containing protein, partial [Candidatus Promineifilaceae bacterium]
TGAYFLLGLNESDGLEWSAIPTRVEGLIADRIGRLEEELREVSEKGEASAVPAARAEPAVPIEEPAVPEERPEPAVPIVEPVVPEERPEPVEPIVVPETPRTKPPTTTPLPHSPTPLASAGEWIVYASNVSDVDEDDTSQTDIWAVKADGSESRQLTFDEASDLSPDLSPDGIRVVFDSGRSSGSGLYAINIDGSNLTRLTRVSSDSDPVWSPNGTQIAFLSERDGQKEIYVMDVDDSNIERLTENDVNEEDIAWSPDGRQIAFTTFEEGTGNNIYVLTIDGGEMTMVTDDKNLNVSPAWSPDGQYLVYTSWLTEEIESGRPYLIFTTKNGREVFLIYRDGESGTTDLTSSINRVAIDGSDVVKLTQGEYSDWSPSFSPDGRHIVFSSKRGGDAEIYIMNADGSGVTALTDNDKGDYTPSW